MMRTTRHARHRCSRARRSTPRSKPANGTVQGRGHRDAKGKAKADSKGVVVYLEDVPGTPATPPKDHAVIDQREKQFDPPLTIVVQGTTVDFPNEDKIFHNVFSVSRPARFDLGLYKSGTTKSVEMKRAGTVDVYCNIHPDMIAKVKVLDNALLHDHRQRRRVPDRRRARRRVSGRRVAAER